MAVGPVRTLKSELGNLSWLCGECYRESWWGRIATGPNGGNDNPGHARFARGRPVYWKQWRHCFISIFRGEKALRGRTLGKPARAPKRSRTEVATPAVYRELIPATVIKD